MLNFCQFQLFPPLFYTFISIVFFRASFTPCHHSMCLRCVPYSRNGGRNWFVDRFFLVVLLFAGVGPQGPRLKLRHEKRRRRKKKRHWFHWGDGFLSFLLFPLSSSSSSFSWEAAARWQTDCSCIDVDNISSFENFPFRK